MIVARTRIIKASLARPPSRPANDYHDSSSYRTLGAIGNARLRNNETACLLVASLVSRPFVLRASFGNHRNLSHH